MLRRLLLSSLLAVGTVSLVGACGGSQSGAPEVESPRPRASAARLKRSVPAEKVDIQVEAQRSGHSLVVRVLGIGRGHQSGKELENPKAWHVSANYDGNAPLRQVLAGPAKVLREPTGAALGTQWNIEVQFMVAFALPDRAGTVALRVQAPGGEVSTSEIPIKAPAQKLSQR